MADFGVSKAEEEIEEAEMDATPEKHQKELEKESGEKKIDDFWMRYTGVDDKLNKVYPFNPRVTQSEMEKIAQMSYKDFCSAYHLHDFVLDTEHFKYNIEMNTIFMKAHGIELELDPRTVFMREFREMPLEDIFTVMELMKNDAIEPHDMSFYEAQYAQASFWEAKVGLDVIAKNPEQFSMPAVENLIRKACVELFKDLDKIGVDLSRSFEFVKAGNEQRREIVQELRRDIASEVVDMQLSDTREIASSHAKGVAELAKEAVEKLNAIDKDFLQEGVNAKKCEVEIQSNIRPRVNYMMQRTLLGSAVIGTMVGAGLTQELNMQSITQIANTIATCSLGGVAITAYTQQLSEMSGRVQKFIDDSTKVLRHTAVAIESFSQKVERLIQNADKIDKPKEDATLKHLKEIEKGISAKIADAEKLQENKPSYSLKDLLFQHKMVEQYRESYSALKDELSDLRKDLKDVQKQINQKQRDEKQEVKEEIIMPLMDACGELKNEFKEIEKEDRAVIETTKELDKSFDELEGARDAMKKGLENGEQIRETHEPQDIAQQMQIINGKVQNSIRENIEEVRDTIIQGY